MIELHIENTETRFERGLKHFFALHGFTESSKGLQITVNYNQNHTLSVEKNGNKITLSLSRPHELYRALTLLKENIAKDHFCLRQERCFDTLCAMFDGSQASSLMTVDSVKQMLLYLAGMGYNMAMLYCEDCFEVKGEPYWGNMRPRYTQAELRELDDFADALGIELVPCIQTLAHLTDAIKRPPYKELSDTASVLLVGEERVYTLLDKIIGQICSCFRSRRIHIGMDEAWDLGLGNYLKKHGYERPDAIMKKHLGCMEKILQKHCLSPMMWADMFLRAHSATGTHKDSSVILTEEDRKMIPDNMHIVYWDYYLTTSEEQERFLDKYLYLTDKVIFAGCARNVRTFASHNEKTFITTNAAMVACKKRGVREIMATVWGDDHRESSTFATLLGLQLFAEHTFTSNPTEETVRTRVEVCTGLAAKVFDDIDRLDRCEAYNDKNSDNLSLTRAVIWQDVLLGLMDKDLDVGVDFATHYNAVADALHRDSLTYPQFYKMLDFYYHVARVMALKATLGIDLAKAYANKNKTMLKQLLDQTLKSLYDEMRALRLAHRTHYLEEYKPIGWEILDIRYGGAIMRLDTAMMRLQDYLDGRLECIEELEEVRLSFSGTDKIRHSLNYNMICSASRL